MKNLIHKFIVVTVGLLAFSCGNDDIFQEDPARAVMENFYQTPSDFESATQGIYALLKANGFYEDGDSASKGIIVVADLLSDNLITSQDGRRSNTQSASWAFDTSTVPTDLYYGAYRLISAANLLLSKIDNLSDGPIKEQYRSEALALRAIAHFEVAKLYCKIPTQSADANSFVGIPYVTEYDPTAQPAREESVSVVYDKIMNDLETSLMGIPDNLVQGRLNKNAVKGVISEVALYMGDYDKVITYATPVVTEVAPAQASDIAGLWTSSNSAGVLFEVPFITGEDKIAINYSQNTGEAIIPEWSVDKAFYDLYDEATEPERVNAYFSLLKNQYVVNKYIYGTLQEGVNNGRYLRVEEVILNLAEAQYLSGQGDALATLDILRDARYTSYAGGESGDALFDAIQLERRKELAFEGDRWFTIKRLLGVPGIPSSYAQGVVRSGNGYLADGSGAAPAELKLPASSHKWQIPVSQFILNRNPNMTQTPGYE